MNTSKPTHRRSALERGFTLLELTVVIVVLLAMIGIGVNYTTGLSDWKQATTVGDSLRSVYIAQKNYLADHPTTNVSSITATDLVPYLPNGLTAMPVIEDTDGNTLGIKVDVSPPVATSGGTVFDPSTDPADSLWDVGIK